MANKSLMPEKVEQTTNEKMTCKEPGGECEKEFSARTLEEIAEVYKRHGMAMIQKLDKRHLQATAKRQKLMKNPVAMEAKMEAKRNEFDTPPKNP